MLRSSWCEAEAAGAASDEELAELAGDRFGLVEHREHVRAGHLEGGFLLARGQRSTEPLLAAGRAMAAYVASLPVAAAADG
ncbi:hypothetical protein ACWEV3_13370 [Saccharopolyspora sp. NPDC003752]